jgi:hypothetical protein
MPERADKTIEALVFSPEPQRPNKPIVVPVTVGPPEPERPKKQQYAWAHIGPLERGPVILFGEDGEPYGVIPKDDTHSDTPRAMTQKKWLTWAKTMLGMEMALEEFEAEIKNRYKRPKENIKELLKCIEGAKHYVNNIKLMLVNVLSPTAPK